jgi:hypothetical protein
VRYEAILVDADPLTFGDVLTLVERLRQVNPDASLFVFARYLDLEQRLGLFDGESVSPGATVQCRHFYRKSRHGR